MKSIPIAHYEKRYLITSCGQVINLANNVPLSPIKQSNGYLHVSLSNGNGSYKQMGIHRLVALHFIPNPYGHPMVNHKDGVKTNNSVENLEWCTCNHNLNHALQAGLRPGYMSMDEKLSLVARVLNGELIRDLAVETGRPETGLSGMLRRAADKSNQRTEWNIEMKRRRRDVAIRNISTVNT